MAFLKTEQRIGLQEREKEKIYISCTFPSESTKNRIAEGTVGAMQEQQLKKEKKNAHKEESETINNRERERTKKANGG